MKTGYLVETIQDECIKLNTPGNKNNYDFLKTLLENKKFIFLGESSHCVKEYSSSKIDLIKYLHKELGFNVIAFESELGDCLLGDYLVETTNIALLEFMQGSIGKMWQNSTNLELFEYIQQTKSYEQPLKLAGVDVQQSEGKHLSSFLLKELPNDLKQKFQKFDDRVNEILKMERIKKKEIQKEFEELINLGEILLQELKGIDLLNEQRLKKGIIHSINNRVDYFKANIEKGFSQLFEYRDYLMARNLEYLAEELYPNEKIIIWAHNLHIKKLSSSSLLSPYKSMFENTNNNIKEQSIVIGYYAKEGKYGNPFGEVFSFKKVNKKHLEWLLNQTMYESFFIPCQPSWANQKMKVLESGGLRLTIKPIEQYDGIIFFKNVNPTGFLANN
ncbi:erythromycin esterase family protein [Oceanobacillus manasiensis]|uniref:erythromycin esterase family protein n=1 Tax=Oceanobacillus manasiensis TaxID=586413 RepID=UPI0005AAF7BC|nr:erythromycin esterase family protein [Oceanobacillus manasiensis]